MTTANPHYLVQKAVASGELLRAPCEVCGEPKAHAHHDDYSRPPGVRWLRSKHHLQWHKLEREPFRPFGKCLPE
jgi:hypothetical protein